MNKNLLYAFMFLLGGLITQNALGVQQDNDFAVCDQNIASCELTQPNDVENCQNNRELQHKACIKQEAAKKADLQKQMEAGTAAQEYLEYIHPDIHAQK